RGDVFYLEPPTLVLLPAGDARIELTAQVEFVSGTAAAGVPLATVALEAVGRRLRVKVDSLGEELLPPVTDALDDLERLYADAAVSAGQPGGAPAHLVAIQPPAAPLTPIAAKVLQRYAATVQSEGREPTERELAEATGRSVRQIADVKKRLRRMSL